MSYSKRLEEVEMEIRNHPEQLSRVIPSLYPFALECGDYEGLWILALWNNPFIKSKTANDTMLADVFDLMNNNGVDESEIKKRFESAYLKYASMRTVEDGKISSMSVKEMEDYFRRTDAAMDALNIPTELHPLDLYYRSESATNDKMRLLNDRKEVERQYAILSSFVQTKIASYGVKIIQKERNDMLKKRIIGSKKVFIIHGHNEAKRREVCDILRDRFGLDPIVLSEQPSQGLTIIEKFEKYASDCAYAFALFTPDDIITASDGSNYLQARPNVIFELGWFYANLGRSRVCILDQESEKSKVFSDLQGVLRVTYKENVSERICEIEKELRSIGII